MFFCIVRDVTNDGQVGRHQIISALPWFSRNPGGHDEHVRPGAIGPIRRAGDLGIVPKDRSVLLKIKRFAFGHTFAARDVKKNNISQLFASDEGCEFPTNVASANEANLLTGLCIAHGAALAPSLANENE